jgi:hypothetical protein
VTLKSHLESCQDDEQLNALLQRCWLEYEGYRGRQPTIYDANNIDFRSQDIRRHGLARRVEDHLAQLGAFSYASIGDDHADGTKVVESLREEVHLVIPRSHITADDQAFPCSQNVSDLTSRGVSITYPPISLIAFRVDLAPSRSRSPITILALPLIFS